MDDTIMNKTTQDETIQALQLRVDNLEYDKNPPPNADWEPIELVGHVIWDDCTLEDIGEL